MLRRREPSFPLSGWECFIALSSCLSTALWAYLPLKRYCLLGSPGGKETNKSFGSSVVSVLEFLPPHPRKAADKLLLQHFARWGDKSLPSSPFYCQITVVEISYILSSAQILLMRFNPSGYQGDEVRLIWGQPHQNSHPSSILDVGY